MLKRKMGREERLSEETLHCTTEPVIIWKCVTAILFAVVLCMSIPEALNQYSKSKRIELVEYCKMYSQLSDIDSCFLCGDSAQSMIQYYRQFDTIGLISLNDWYMADFELCPDSGLDATGPDMSSCAYLTQINTGLVNIFADNISSAHRTEMQVIWKDGLTLDTELIEKNLCQSCLTKVADSLTVYKRRYENKSPIPFCLVDFQTLELYSVQDYCTEYAIRDYWVDLKYFDQGLEIEAFY